MDHQKSTILWIFGTLSAGGCGGHGCYFRPNPRVISQNSAFYNCTGTILRLTSAFRWPNKRDFLVQIEFEHPVCDPVATWRRNSKSWFLGATYINSLFICPLKFDFEGFSSLPLWKKNQVFRTWVGFFQGGHLIFFSGLHYKPRFFFQGGDPKENQWLQNLKVFLWFETDLDFSNQRSGCRLKGQKT